MRLPDRNDRYYFPAEMRGAERRYTLCVDFTAEDDDQARLLAEMYTCGLNWMRLEVDFYTARVFPAGHEATASPVFCLAPGPHPSDVCSDIAGHHGEHTGPGVTHIWVITRCPACPTPSRGRRAGRGRAAP